MGERPDTTSIVIGHHALEKKELAWRLRREMTSAEARLWQCLRTNRLGGLKFRRQQVIDGFIADFYCHAAALVVEVDGGVHDDRAGYDEERDRIMAARGLCILRFTNDEVRRDMQTVLDKIHTIATDRIQTINLNKKAK